MACNAMTSHGILDIAAHEAPELRYKSYFEPPCRLNTTHSVACQWKSCPVVHEDCSDRLRDDWEGGGG